MVQVGDDVSCEDISEQNFIDEKASELKLQNETSVADHTSEFQNLINQLTNVDLKYEDEMQTILLSSLLDSWETFSLSNSEPNEKLIISTVKDTIFNEDAKKREMGMTN